MTQISRYVGVHNALGSKLAERAGFDGVWLSGFEMSASYCVPDADLLTLSQQLEIAKSVVRAAGIPVLVDCDSGYGHPTNTRYATREFVDIGVAGICIEDKPFPKMNSFDSRRQNLSDPKDMAAKIFTAKSEAVDKAGFEVVARTEALIVGGTVQDALSRASLYRRAGADAILIHDNVASSSRVSEFAARWEYDDTPLIAVPTTYYEATGTQLQADGFARVIYANHGLRSIVADLQRTYETILADDSTMLLEDRISSVGAVFDLQAVDRMHTQEAQIDQSVQDLL